MHLFSIHKDTDSVQDLLFYLYRLPLPLILSDILYLYHSTIFLLSDPHTAWIDSTFYIFLRTQLYIHYSDALNDPESLNKLSTSSLAQASFPRVQTLTQNYCIL